MADKKFDIIDRYKSGDIHTAMKADNLGEALFSGPNICIIKIDSGDDGFVYLYPTEKKGAIYIRHVHAEYDDDIKVNRILKHSKPTTDIGGMSFDWQLAYGKVPEGDYYYVRLYKIVGVPLDLSERNGRLDIELLLSEQDLPKVQEIIKTKPSEYLDGVVARAYPKTMELVLSSVGFGTNGRWDVYEGTHSINSECYKLMLELFNKNKKEGN